MPILQRYFWRQAFLPMMLTLAALALLALLTQSLQTLDLIVENRQSALTFLKITGLALPQLIGIILPLAIFMATLYALNRMNMDSELIVAKAAGISPWQIASPVVRLGLLAMIAHLVISLAIQPLSFRQMRAELLKVRTDIASQMVVAGDFVSPSPGLTLYARDIAPSGELLDVIIYDARDKDDIITQTAETGEVRRTPGGATLTLRRGAVQQVLEDGSLDVIEFQDYVIDLTDTLTVDRNIRLKSSDLFVHELLKPDPRSFINKSQRREYASEGHARLSAPIYNVTLVLLALCFMIRGEHLRLGYGRRIIVAGAIGFLIRLSGFAVASAAESNSALNILQYGLPIGIALACLIYLFSRRKAGRRRRKASRAVFARGSDNRVAPL